MCKTSTGIPSTRKELFQLKRWSLKARTNIERIYQEGVNINSTADLEEDVI